MSADDRNSLVRAAHEAAARLAAMQEPAWSSEAETQDAETETQDAFREHLHAVSTGSWVSVPVGDWL